MPRGSTLITRNQAIKDWPEVLVAGEVMATAPLDRLLHGCDVLLVKGRCYRLRGLKGLTK